MVTRDPTATVDTSPIVVTEIVVDGESLAVREPLRFGVTLNQEFEPPFFQLDGEFEIMLGAETRKELLELLEDELTFLWRVYAKADPESLSPGARRLGEALRSRLTPKVHAT